MSVLFHFTKDTLIYNSSCINSKMHHTNMGVNLVFACINDSGSWSKKMYINVISRRVCP